MTKTSRRAPRSGRSATRAAHTVRIIGGSWKRTPLAVLDEPGLRPTPDRVRETLFNWLDHQTHQGLASLSVLDLFAGSGALGFEAASRGAARVVLVETSRPALAALSELKARLTAERVEIVAHDALQMLGRFAREGTRFDLIFLDPPFNEGWIPRVLAPATARLAAGGLLYIECEQGLEAEQMASVGLELLRKDKAGQVFYHLLRKESEHQDEGETSC